MRIIKFSVVAAAVWLPATFGLGIAADAVGLPDTDTCTWILRGIGAAMAACVAWMVIGAAKATAVFRAVMPVMSLVTHLIYSVCLVLGVTAVVMIFVKDWNWLYQHLYQPFVLPLIAMSFFSLVPVALLLVLFRRTRALGAISLYLLSLFFEFALWFYSLMVAGSHGPGWVIGGLLMGGLGVIPSAAVASAVWGQWSVAGSILLIGVTTLGTGILAWVVAERRFEKDEDAERSAEEADSAQPMPSE